MPRQGTFQCSGRQDSRDNPCSRDFFIEKLSKEFEINIPTEHGADSVNAVMRMKRRGGIFLSLGGNFLSAMSDTEYTAEALENCNLTVQISTKLNRSHLITGDVGMILPCLGGLINRLHPMDPNY